MKKLLAVILLLALGPKLQAAEARRVKAPPPVIIGKIPDEHTELYAGFEGNYWYQIDKTNNTVKVYDMSDPEHPVLISTNEYEAKQEEEKKAAAE